MFVSHHLDRKWIFHLFSLVFFPLHILRANEHNFGWSNRTFIFSSLRCVVVDQKISDCVHVIKALWALLRVRKSSFTNSNARRSWLCWLLLLVDVKDVGSVVFIGDTVLLMLLLFASLVLIGSRSQNSSTWLWLFSLYIPYISTTLVYRPSVSERQCWEFCDWISFSLESRARPRSLLIFDLDDHQKKPS